MNFQAVCAKAKNFVLVLQWIKRSKQPASSIQNQLRENFSNYEELDLMMAVYFIYENYRAWSRDRTKRAKNSYTERKTEECFQRKTIGLVQEETLVVFHARMPRETVRTRGMTWRAARNSHLEQSYSSIPKVKKQTDGKA